MKKITALIILVLAGLSLTAQINVNLLVNPNPPSSLMQWNDKRETLTYLALFRLGQGKNKS